MPSPGPCLATIVVNPQKSKCKQPLVQPVFLSFFWRISYTICVTVIITLLQIPLVIPIIFAWFHTESLKDSLQKCPRMAMTRPQSHSTQLCLLLKQKLNPRVCHMALSKYLLLYHESMVEYSMLQALVNCREMSGRFHTYTPGRRPRVFHH